MAEMADFLQRAREMRSRIDDQLTSINTEEATKHAFVLPVLQALGYDVFNPKQVVPEFVADVGVKKGEKVDYALFHEGEARVLIECKAADVSLNETHNSQLFRYFAVTKARLGILTNGLVYQFYSDLESANVMDSKPFLEVDLRTADEQSLEEFWAVSHAGFLVDEVVESAFQMKYTKALSKLLDEEFRSPSVEFVRFFVSQIYDGRVTQNVVDRFTPFIRQAVARTLTNRFKARFQAALDLKEPEGAPDEAAPSAAAETSPSSEVEASALPEQDEIMTTEEELMAFYAVKSILAKQVDVKRVTYRDGKTYCAVLLDNNNRKPLCRLWFNTRQKYVGLFDAEKKETRVAIASVDDIYGHTDALRERLKIMLAEGDDNSDQNASSNGVQGSAG